MRGVRRTAQARDGLQPVQLAAQPVVHVDPTLGGRQPLVLDQHETVGGLVVVDQVTAEPCLDRCGVDVGDLDAPTLVLEHVDVAAEAGAVPRLEESWFGDGVGGIVLDEALLGRLGDQPCEVGVVRAPGRRQALSGASGNSAMLSASRAESYCSCQERSSMRELSKGT